MVRRAAPLHRDYADRRLRLTSILVYVLDVEGMSAGGERRRRPRECRRVVRKVRLAMRHHLATFSDSDLTNREAVGRQRVNNEGRLLTCVDRGGIRGYAQAWSHTDVAHSLDAGRSDNDNVRPTITIDIIH